MQTFLQVMNLNTRHRKYREKSGDLFCARLQESDIFKSSPQQIYGRRRFLRPFLLQQPRSGVNMRCNA